MFNSDLKSDSTSFDAINNSLMMDDALLTAQNYSAAYGLQSGIDHYDGMGSGIPLGNSKYVDNVGNILIEEGNTTTAEINEVNTLLNRSIYNRNYSYGDRSYTNSLYYRSDDVRARQSANESVGMDRGDSLTNAINVGTVTYRNGVDIDGNIGYTVSGSRDRNDFFRFEVGKAGQFTLSLAELSRDAGLALYDASYKLVKNSDRAGAASETISHNLTTGTYYARVYSYDGRWNHGSTSYDLSIDRSADSLEKFWQDILFDKSVENAALNAIRYDNSLSRNDVIGILKSAGDYGSINSTELTDLRNFYNEAINTVNVESHIKVLSQKVIFSDTSNQWYTGSDSLRDDLGDLVANSKSNHLNLLIGKHFLGTDRPAIHRDSSNTLAGSYTRAGGQLFVDGASMQDIKQGATGDCYFLAGLGSIAHDKTSAISDMFVDNGDGTWSVRFYTQDKVDYVTVDRMMPTNSTGQYFYANKGESVAGNNELWVALAEKAYAQVNESGRIAQDGTNFYGNGNDNGIGWGFPGTAKGHIANVTTTDEYLRSSSSRGVSQTELIDLANSNRALTIGSFNYRATMSNAGETSISTAIQGHQYVITGYKGGTGQFTLRNPWGEQHLSLTFNQLLQLGGRLTYSNK